MEDVLVHWIESEFVEEEQEMFPGKIREGVLTTQHSASVDGMPVLVEAEGERVYTAADLPADAVLFVEAPPGPLPPMAEAAIEAGFTIRHAEESTPDIELRGTSEDMRFVD